MALVLRAWVGGRLAWGLFLFYLATLGFYLYVRLTSTLDLGLHYQWCMPAPCSRVRLLLIRIMCFNRIMCTATCVLEHDPCFIMSLAGLCRSLLVMSAAYSHYSSRI